MIMLKNCRRKDRGDKTITN